MMQLYGSFTSATIQQDIIPMLHFVSDHGVKSESSCDKHPAIEERQEPMGIAKKSGASLTALLLLSACAAQPMGPSVTVMPAPGKAFEVFQADQAMCKTYADAEVAGGAQQANTQQVLTGALGTVLGAGLGAAIGGGKGAAIGAASGALGGAAIGTGPSARAQGSLQQRYDGAFMQCMSAQGNQIPTYASPNYGQPPRYGQPAGGYPPPGHAPSPYYAPQAYAPPAYAPPAYAPPGYPQPGYAQPGYPPAGYPPAYR